MNMYNSSNNSYQDDPDLTMINHSFLFAHNADEVNTFIPVVRRAQQANSSSNNTQTTAIPSQPKIGQNKIATSNSKQDFIFVDHDRQETAKQIEEILNYYQRDLKQDTNTQLDCDRHLIRRLVDFIRPIYSSNKKKINDLDTLISEIGTLHDKRYVEQQEKNEQLQNEIRYFKRLIITTPNEDDNRCNTMTKVYRMNSMVDYEQWKEIEEETKRLQNLVELQRNQIDQIVEYTSPEGSLIKSTTEAIDDGTQTERRGAITNPLAPISRQPSHNVPEQSPLCGHEFRATVNEPEIPNHDEQRLSPTGADNPNVPIEPNQYQCPYCEEDLPGNDELGYLQHISDCYSAAIGNF